MALRTLCFSLAFLVAVSIPVAAEPPGRPPVAVALPLPAPVSPGAGVQSAPPPPAATPPAPAAGPAGPALPTPAQAEACLPPGFLGAGSKLVCSVMAPDGRTLSYCMGFEESSRCLAFDVAAGRFSALEPRSGAEWPCPAPPPPGLTATVTVRKAALTVTVCRRGQEDCFARLSAKPPFPVEAEQVQASVNPQATRLAVTFASDRGGVVRLLALPGGKRIAELKPRDESYRCVSAEFLDDVLLYNSDVCAGPGGRAFLVDSATGRELAELGQGAGEYGFNSFGTTPCWLGGSRWAFQEMGGGRVIVQDLPTGKLERVIELPETEGMDDGVDMRRGADGSLVLIYETGMLRFVDPATGRSRDVKPRPCPAPPGKG